jgi:HD-like signal output (HDOD) protein
MTPAERRRQLLGDAVIADIHQRVEEALTEAPPTPELIAKLRRILTRPGGQLVDAQAQRNAA